MHVGKDTQRVKDDKDTQRGWEGDKKHKQGMTEREKDKSGCFET